MSGVMGGAGSKSGVIGRTELDYEEGTWTPVFADTADGDQIAPSGTPLGSYRKIGKFVHISGIYIAGGSLGSASGHIRMQGLPFSPGSTGAACQGVINVGNGQSYAMPGNNTVTMRVNQSDKIANMYKWSSTTGTSSFTAAEFSTGGEIQFGGTYITDN